MTVYRFLPLPDYHEHPVDEMIRRARGFHADLRRRRTVRHFSTRPVPHEVIEYCVRTAGTAPSGANQQPWHFAIVEDERLKHRIRQAAEQEESRFYGRRAPAEWLAALAPMGTDEHKPFLEAAPCLIVIFAQTYGLRPDGGKTRNYYVSESVGIATGLLIAAIHHAGLVSLTHTPSPMRFLNEILGRPANERPFLVLVAGYPSKDAVVPEIEKKSFEQIAKFY